MVLIEGGTFTMGDIYDNTNPDAKPVHQVTLSDFKIGKYEVTYRQYDAFARRTARKLPEADSLQQGNRPVVNIDWQDARAFCNYYGWRLPTEQEWEYAARSGGKKMRFAGTNNIDSLNIYARTQNNSAPFAFKVGTKKPNSAGLYDMSGNVFEWIGNYYQFYPKNGKEPTWDKLENKGVRIIRGGSFEEGKYIASTYWRVGVLADAKANDVGFRCVDPLNK
ncbi:Formylglycine-generating enzyme, required for sulfatase activity, contains SUMF1/FGE domain [Fodinibius salinus]|uniref:Formylglycine-generating enzyme, required for sulfatase activity, contains SUMF1/FGE domain n=2 Tax=Fodinibius salinus TaxID=860790 RepID=A0A5D3YM26_9BACT|nr:Formylglycine-generating enzyme, required for sulfatase activity, contains SUMF1/FGE domain [Fodinibius salinus]